jgi:hypothetical protein
LFPCRVSTFLFLSRITLLAIPISIEWFVIVGSSLYPRTLCCKFKIV